MRWVRRRSPVAAVFGDNRDGDDRVFKWRETHEHAMVAILEFHVFALIPIDVLGRGTDHLRRAGLCQRNPCLAGRCEYAVPAGTLITPHNQLLYEFDSFVIECRVALESRSGSFEDLAFVGLELT